MPPDATGASGPRPPTEPHSLPCRAETLPPGSDPGLPEAGWEPLQGPCTHVLRPHPTAAPEGHGPCPHSSLQHATCLATPAARARPRRPSPTPHPRALPGSQGILAQGTRRGPGKLPSPGSFGAPSCMFWPLPSLPAAPGDGPPHGPQFTDGAETSPCSHAVCPPSPWLVQEPSPSGSGK